MSCAVVWVMHTPEASQQPVAKALKPDHWEWSSFWTLSAKWPWSDYVTSSCLSFLNSKMGTLLGIHNWKYYQWELTTMSGLFFRVILVCGRWGAGGGVCRGRGFLRVWMKQDWPSLNQHDGYIITSSFFKNIILFICFQLGWVPFASRAFPQLWRAGGYSLVAVHRLLIVVASRCGAWALGCKSISSCGSWAQRLWLLGSRAQAHYLRCMGLVAQWHVESSQIQRLNCVSWISRWFLYHWITKEAPSSSFGYAWNVPQ